MKTCPRCDEHKWLSEYHVNRRSRDGKQSWCKACMIEVMQEKRARLYKCGLKANGEKRAA